MMGTRGRRGSAALAIACVLCAGAAAGGCSSLLGIESDRYLAASDSATIEAAGDDAGADAPDVTVEPPGYACLNDPVPSPAPAPLELAFFLNDVSSASSADSFAGSPLVGATAMACSTLDLTCAHPITSGTSNDGGIAILGGLPSGFDGYYQVQAPNYPSAILARPHLLQSEQVEQGLVSNTVLTVGPALVGVTQDPNNTIAIVSVFDCSSATASGITVSIGAPAPNEKLFYFENSLPTAAATSTDSTGSAIIFNVPPGTIAVTATLPNSTQTLPTMTAITRVGWVSFVAIRPYQATVVTPH
jgi:hypothetical protein